MGADTHITLIIVGKFFGDNEEAYQFLGAKESDVQTVVVVYLLIQFCLGILNLRCMISIMFTP